MIGRRLGALGVVSLALGAVIVPRPAGAVTPPKGGVVEAIEVALSGPVVGW